MILTGDTEVLLGEKAVYGVWRGMGGICCSECSKAVLLVKVGCT